MIGTRESTLSAGYAQERPAAQRGTGPEPLPSDTIVAVSTAKGPAPRGIVRLSGPKAEAIVGAAACRGFRRPRRNYSAVSAEIALPEFTVPATIYVMRGPRSYTREDVIEIHTFGAPPLLQAVMERLVAAGARPAGPGEFTRRAFLNGRLDLTQAEAVQAVVGAAGEAEYRAAQEALVGGLAARLRPIRAELVRLAASVEVSLDFSDQDVEIISRSEVVESAGRIRAALDELLSRASDGRLGSHAVRVVLYGPPNAGKSSLFNAILRQRRTIVSVEPHTTRDTVETEVTIAGRPLLLVDTAGLHAADDDLRAAAVARSEAARRSADLLLCVLDSSRSPGEEEARALRAASASPALILLNKSDLGPCDSGLAARLPARVDRLRVSARTGAGLDDVLRWLAEWLSDGRVERFPADLMLNARQTALLKDARASLDRIVRPDVDEGGTQMDLVATDLNEALDALSRITGDAVTEDVLDRIFADFCIGK